MLRRGYLASTSIYLSCAHTKKIIEEYLFHVDKVFKLMSELISQNKIKDRLETRVRSDSFTRLT